MAIDLTAYVNSYASITRYCADELTAKAHPEMRAGHKCRSCGSFEYVLAASGSICAYCRNPEFTGSREAKPSPVDHEWERLETEIHLQALRSMYGIHAAAADHLRVKYG